MDTGVATEAESNRRENPVFNHAARPLLLDEIAYSRQTMVELREYSRRLDLLRRIDRAVLMAGSAAAIAGLVLPLLRDLIPHSHAAIYRQEPRGQILTLLAEDGSGQPLAKLEDRLELGDLGVAFEFGPERFCPVILFLGEGPILCAVPRQLHAAGIDVLMAVPLGHHDRMLGVLLLGGTGPASFSGPQTEIAQEVGGIISLALAHSELLENVTRSRGQLSIISAPGAGAVIKASCPLIKTREEDHVP